MWVCVVVFPKLANFQCSQRSVGSYSAKSKLWSLHSTVWNHCYIDRTDRYFQTDIHNRFHLHNNTNNMDSLRNPPNNLPQTLDTSCWIRHKQMWGSFQLYHFLRHGACLQRREYNTIQRSKIWPWDSIAILGLSLTNVTVHSCINLLNRPSVAKEAGICPVKLFVCKARFPTRIAHRGKKFVNGLEKTWQKKTCDLLMKSILPISAGNVPLSWLFDKSKTSEASEYVRYNGIAFAELACKQLAKKFTYSESTRDCRSP